MRIALLSFVVCILISSCEFLGGERVRGNGNVVTKNINVGSFDGVETLGDMNVVIIQSEQASVRVSADENLFEFIETHVEGNTLVVKTKSGYNLDPSRDIVIYAAAPVFREVVVEGSGNVSTENAITGSQELKISVSGSGDVKMQVNVSRLSAIIAGSGSVALRGTATNFSVNVEGSGEVRSFDLITDNADVSLAGSADAQVTANKNLDVNISGSGTIQYRGNPTLKQHIAGSGSVEKVG